MTVFENNIINIYGEYGRAWLSGLPQLVGMIAFEYDLSDLKPVSNLSYNYVLSGSHGAQSIILKLSPDIEGLNREAAARLAFAGSSAAKVLAVNDGMLILECAVPGDSLKSYFPIKDDEAVLIACDAIKSINLIYNRSRAAPKGDGFSSVIDLSTRAPRFPHIKDWLVTLDVGSKLTGYRNWGMLVTYLKKAKLLRDNLLETQDKPILLHGDLHHDNILQHGTTWVVIDPKGVIGEMAYEVAAFLRNPIPELIVAEDIDSIISNRIASFAKILGLAPQRIIDWSFVQAVLAWVWALEDGCDADSFMCLAAIFDKIGTN